MILEREVSILRELAKRYADIAANQQNDERRDRMTKTNDLVTGLRPTVLVDELPWHEMNFDNSLITQCETPFAVKMEMFFRRRLFYSRYLRTDLVFSNFYPIAKSYEVTDNGIDANETILATNTNNNIVSHEYHDMLESFDQLEKFKRSVVTAFPDKDREHMALAREILGDILPVRLVGASIYYAPWDVIPRLRGVEPILFDMIDRPEFLHAIIGKFTENQDGIMTQMENLGLYESEPELLHCTPAFTTQLPQPDYNGKTRLKDIWFRSMAQMFSVVSNSDFVEYELNYMRPLMERCGLVYYGCCEPLVNRIDLLKSIPNLRKLGVTPWTDIPASAEKMGSDYVFARKPNPAFVATVFDADTVKNEIEETVKLCIKYNCPYEFVLKDISTVNHKPQNLIDWCNTVGDVLDRYY